MQKTIKPWSENGTNVAMTPAEIAAGWKGNDQPSAENWNFIQNERDIQQISDAEARAVRFFGLHPENLRGNSDSGIPRFRPTDFVGQNIWDPSAAVNNLDLVGVLGSATLGWDPASNMPVLAVLRSNSFVDPGSSASIVFIKCWEYGATPEYETRRIYFGFVSDTDESNTPIFICDGKLYVVAQQASPPNRYILRYDLLNWTGYPDASRLIGANSAVTEIAEISATQIALACQYNAVDGQVRLIKINKDLESATTYLVFTLAGAAIGKNFRTDGAYAYISGQDADAYPLVSAFNLSANAATNYAAGIGFSGNYVADLLPLRSGADHPTNGKSVACLIMKQTAPYGPFIRVCGEGEDFEFDKVFNFGLFDDAFLFDKSVPGVFCTFGTSSFAVLNRRVGSGETITDTAELVPFNRTALYRSATFPYLAARPLDGICAGPSLMGDNILLLHKRAFHDGRSVWIVDRYCRITRIVAPETRSV